MPLTSKDLHSFPGCLNELCLKAITGNKTDHTKLTVRRLGKGKRQWAALSEIMFLECGLGTRFVIWNVPLKAVVLCYRGTDYADSLSIRIPRMLSFFFFKDYWVFLTYLENHVTIITEETSSTNMQYFKKYAFSITYVCNCLCFLFACWEVKKKSATTYN